MYISIHHPKQMHNACLLIGTNTNATRTPLLIYTLQVSNIFIAAFLNDEKYGKRDIIATVAIICGTGGKEDGERGGGRAGR